MTCHNCKYYLHTSSKEFCGLGMSPRDTQTENFCSIKEEGNPERIKFKDVNPLDYDPDKRLEQAPTIFKLVANNTLAKFKREHILTKFKREVKISLWYKKESWERKINFFEKLYPNAIVKLIEPRGQRFFIIEITYTESKKEAFLKKKNKFNNLKHF